MLLNLYPQIWTGDGVEGLWVKEHLSGLPTGSWVQEICPSESWSPETLFLTDDGVIVTDDGIGVGERI